MIDHAYAVTVCAARHCGEPMSDHPTNADLAVIARRKAGKKRHIAAIAGTTEWVRHVCPNLNDGRLPTAAFDWPIYLAARPLATDY